MPLYTKFAKTFSVALCTLPLISYAVSFPRGCEITGFGFSKNYVILNEQANQAFFLIQNRSNTDIELEHYETRSDVFMSPKLETKLGANRWAAFASDEANTYFQCFKKVNDERIIVDCRDALDICQYPRVKFALSNMGNYWVSTDKDQQQVIKDATAKGIYLKW